MGIPDNLTSLLRNLYAGQEATIRTRHGTMDWFQIGKGVHQGCILSPYIFNLYAEYFMKNAKVDKAQAGIKIARRNIKNLRYADDTTLMAESKEELKSLLMKVKEESEKVGLTSSIRPPSYSANLDEEAQAGTSSLQVMLDRHPVAITVEVKQEEDIKPPPPLVLNSQQSDTLEQREEQALVPVMERSLSPSLSSVDMRMTSSPSSIPRRDDFYRHESGENFRSQLGYDPQILQMLKEERQIILENQKSFGLYVQEKRDGLKRREQLEEELLRAKIEVEKLKAIRLRHDLPEYNSL
uniref:Uncharacterized protein n=2 Tax=Ovis TaxID=9935 RepID=A0AC11BZ79_SHEEP